MKRFFSLLLMTLFASLPGLAGEDWGLLRFPDINNDQIVFVYAGDIWTVNSKGGEARRLTSHEGFEVFPKLSPDGKWIAFSGEYSGTRQIYVIPSKGGTPKQLTFYNDVGSMPPRGGYDYVVLDWTPDSGKVLVRANRTPYGKRVGKYYLVDINGGLETPLPVPEGGFGSFSPDGMKLCYTPISREFRTWKRYKGGRAADIWVYDLIKNESEKITKFKGSDQIPHWYENGIYYASDKDLTLNIYRYNLDDKTSTQLTFHKDYDVMWPSGNNGQLVYENGGKIFKLNLESGQEEQVKVDIHFDNPNLLPVFTEVKDNIDSFNISPTGKRALFDARGDIYSVPAEEGLTINLTDTQGIRETFPTWSPDGKYILYYSDKTGEYEMYLQDKDLKKAPVQLTKDTTAWMFPPLFSPDSKTVAFSDKNQTLKALDVASGKITLIDRADNSEITHYAFSADSKWLTYTKNGQNGQNAVWVYSFESGKVQQLTGDTFDDFSPVFSECGNYIFFLSNRDFNLEFSSFEFNYLYNDATRIYALALNPSVPPLFKDKNDVEEVKADTPKDEKKENSKNKSNKKEVKSEKSIVIDFNNVSNRIVALPLKSGNYRGLTPVKGGLLYADREGIHKFDIDSEKSTLILGRARGYQLSADGKKLMYSSGGTYGIVDLKPKQKAGDGKLNLDGLVMKLDPGKEWVQIFNDGWRIFRDWFYVKNTHNVDWPAMKEKYGKLLPYLSHRTDLDYILGEMIGESNTGHCYVNSSAPNPVKRIDGGLLGAELQANVKIGKYQFKKIFKGENWNKSRVSPLTKQGIDVKEGDFLISLNGTDISIRQNPYEFLENTAGEKIYITVNSTPSKDGARTYLIEPVKSEQELRYINWVEKNREMVDKLSGGKIGYIHVPNTAVEGNRELFRGMYTYYNKEALIIDDRYNGGGFIPDVMADLLDRKTLSYWARAGLDFNKTPAIAHDGPKAMLINGYSSSGGDAFPYYFRKKGLGTIIGTRTWGGLVGISWNAGFVDGGSLSVPSFGFFNTEGQWDVEGVGVSPDIEVIDYPHLIAQGKDPSIEKAVEVLLKELENNPPKKVTKPVDPDRSGWIETK